MTVGISSICVEGLHGRISFNLSLKPDLNIIYGKNGLGKTTLLHIIANIAEGDIDRFAHLNFSEISLKNFLGDSLKLKRSSARVIEVYLNEVLVHTVGAAVDDSEAIEKRLLLLESLGDQLRSLFGDRPCYLPAFRSVLERSRDFYSGVSEDVRGTAYDEIIRREEALLRAKSKRGRSYYPREHVSRATALKTVRCRGWFGAMVPIVRYPSISDVAEGLSEEWTSANLTTSRLEQVQYEQAFLNIFETVLLDESSTSTADDQGNLLEKIRQLLNDDTVQKRGGRDGKTYDRLFSVAKKAGVAGTRYNAVLEIYLKLLERRKTTRESEFKPIVEFENAVNTFLDRKELRIGISDDITDSPMRREFEKARIYPEKGKPYPILALSSGERQIATMLFAASRSSLTPGSLLIDEPELSLHVDWQRHILRELRNQNPDRQIIACTHSPEVGADHKSSILFFRPTVFDATEETIDEQVGEENE